jgi:hypothetical protein
MAIAKKGALAQRLVVMVDATDFASVESAITESDFNSGATRKFYGYNHGGSAATTSGTISKTASLVRSGVFRLTLKSTENNYDRMMVRISKTGCAEQIIEWDNVDNDDSDLMSAILLAQSAASDAASGIVVANSRILLNQSRISDVYSLLSDTNSDLRSLLATTGIALDASTLSDLRSAIAAGPTGTLTASDISDIASAVWANTIGARVDSRVVLNLSRISDVYSLLSDTGSDLRSLVTTTGVTLDASTMSDLRSAIAGITASVSASDISDIASAVWANAAGAALSSRVLLNLSRISDVYSMTSNTLSAFQSQFESRVPKAVATNSQLSDLHSDLRSYLGVMSGVLSDTYSLLSDTNSDFRSLVTTTGVQINASALSDLRSAIAAGPAATVTAYDISDIASAVRALLVSDISDILSRTTQINSRVVLMQSSVSDVHSQAIVTQSMISDLYSALSDALSGPMTASDLSDIASAVWAHTTGAATASRVLLNLSRVSDIYSLLSDHDSNMVSLVGTTGVNLNASVLSDLRSAIAAGPAATVTASDISDIASAVWAIATGAAVSSRVLVNMSRISDLQSALSDAHSDLGSKIGTVAAAIDASSASDVASAVWAHATGAATASRVLLNLSRISDVYSLLSDANSDLGSRLTVIQSGVSDAASAATQINSRVLVAQSFLSDIRSGVSDLHSDMSSKLSNLNTNVSLDASDLSDIASAVWATARTEPTAAPTATGTMKSAMEWMLALSRNKITQTATVQSLRNDADAADIASAAVADDGTTFTRAEWGN